MLRTISNLKKVNRFYWFIFIVTFLKIVLMGLFSSDYQNKMFIPFVSIFLNNITNGYFNPYEYYYNNHLLVSFPYPPLMLYIESIGGFLVQNLSHYPLFIRNIIFKIPNLIFDFVGLYYLMKMYPHRRKYVGVLYFASPIILYASYMHGQLDIIPTALLIGCMYYLLSQEPFNKCLFTIFFAAALLTKLHILVMVPVLFIYIQKRDGFNKALQLMLFTFAVTIGIMLPFMGEAFYASVLFNNEQQLLTKVFLEFVNVKIYFPVLAILFIYLQEFAVDTINRDLLMSFSGVLFAALLVLLPPMPGWYIWIVPFITVFFINVNNNKHQNLWIYSMLNGVYIIYFIVFHQTSNVDLYLLTINLSILKIQQQIAVNVVFTLLGGILAYITILMYKLGIMSNSLYKRKNIPFTIGIAGDSGSGKSTFINLVELCLGKRNLLFIEGDGDHKWERGEKMWDVYTHLNPKANYLYRQARDIQTLRKGAYVKRVDYDHDTGTFSSEYTMYPNRYILLCGLHSFYLPQMRKVLDLKIYMDADETLRRYWKIKRDMVKRGYAKEEIVKQIERRMEDAKKFIIPQKEYADLVIHYFDKNLLDCFIDEYEVIMSLKLILSSAINLEPMIEFLTEYGIEISHDYSEDLKKQMLVFEGSSIKNVVIPFEKLINEYIPQVDEITRQDLYCNDVIKGILQFVLLKLISYKMQGEIS